VTGIVSASGLNGAALSLPLLRRLVELYKVPLEGERLRLNAHCGVPGLDRRGSRCAVMGAQAASVLAHADTIAGLKYVGRRFVADCYRAERWAGTIERRGLADRLGMQLALARDAAGALRLARTVEGRA
jgi:hypothetical protein